MGSQACVHRSCYPLTWYAGDCGCPVVSVPLSAGTSAAIRDEAAAADMELQQNRPSSVDTSPANGTESGTRDDDAVEESAAVCHVVVVWDCAGAGQCNH